MSERVNADAPAAADEDWDLIRRIGTGDQGALERLYRRYYDYLYRFVYQVTRRAECVEDVINEVMFVVWQKAAQTVPRARASTWILGIANHKALNAVSRSGTQTVAMDSEEAEQVSDEALGARQLESDDLMFAALQVLSPEQRAVMEMVYYHGLHYSTIAELMDCPENTVKTRIFHARKRLKAVWAELSGSDAPAGGRQERSL